MLIVSQNLQIAWLLLFAILSAHDYSLMLLPILLKRFMQELISITNFNSLYWSAPKPTSCLCIFLFLWDKFSRGESHNTSSGNLGILSAITLLYIGTVVCDLPLLFLELVSGL